MNSTAKYNPLIVGAIDVDPSMSNFDHTIDDGVEEALRTQPCAVYAEHFAWNHCGKVWWDGRQFCEEVFVYKESQGVISADNLRGLMDAVNDEYGSE